jgi:hypothetical protein
MFRILNLRRKFPSIAIELASYTRNSLLSDFSSSNEQTWEAEKLSPNALCFNFERGKEIHLWGNTGREKHDDKIVKRSDNSIQLSRKSRNGSKCCREATFFLCENQSAKKLLVCTTVIFMCITSCFSSLFCHWVSLSSGGGKHFKI